MTFDHGVSTKTSSQAEITESLIRLIAQFAISLAIVGAYLIAVMQDNAAAANLLQPVALGVIAFWLGQSAVSAWENVQQQKLKRAASEPAPVTEIKHE